MRGEKFITVVSVVMLLGSPPHARGKASFCASNTEILRDHPRMRGEKRAEKQQRGF